VEFKNEFDVEAPVDEVYQTMLDLEKVAPAMPGAQVLEKIDDDHYKVAIKVKVGPISMQYRGDVEVVDKDPQSHSAKLKVQARETRGQGTAAADVVMRMTERDGKTHGEMETSVQLAGRAAAMGGGVIKDVSAKLVDQFAGNLGKMLAGGPAEEAPAAAASAPETASNGGAAAGDAGAAPASGGAQAPAGAGAPAGSGAQPKAGAGAGAAASGGSSTSFDQDDDDAGLDVLGIAASVTADKLKDPRVLLGTLGFVLLLGWLFGRSSSR
jgi:carbon monoxide dehydrogenase subunit G